MINGKYSLQADGRITDRDNVTVATVEDHGNGDLWVHRAMASGALPVRRYGSVEATLGRLFR